jgi:hypothetical protein
MNMDQLTAANPVPSARALDDRALFERIVALPHERGRRVPRKRTAVVLAFAVAAVLAPTTYGVSSWLAAVKPPVTLQEYSAAQRYLTLPPGYTWPVLHVDSNSVTSPGAGGGHAVTVAMVDWECYWVSAIRSHDATAQERAHAELRTLLHDNTVVAPAGASENWSPPVDARQPVQVFADDGGYQYKERMYAAAAAGDPTLLMQSCAVNGIR